MVKISKSQEPTTLTSHRAIPGASYDDMPEVTKSTLRQSLASEQGFVCAYCMRRIEANSTGMKIEHVISRSDQVHNGPSLQLDYRNLFGCCDGNSGSPHSAQHCDTYKGAQSVLINLASVRTTEELEIKYMSNGTILSSRSDVQGLIEMLNLNGEAHHLRANRAGVIKSLQRQFSGATGPVTKSRIRDLLNRWNKRDGKGRYQENFGVAVYFLEQKLKQVRS